MSIVVTPEKPVPPVSVDAESLLLPRPQRAQTQGPAEPVRLLSGYEEFLVPALLLFVLGHVLAYALPGLPFARLSVGVPLLALIAGSVFYGVGRTRSGERPRRRLVWLGFWLMLLIAGSLHYQVRHFQPGLADIGRLTPQDGVAVMGRLESVTERKLVLRVMQVAGKVVTGKAWVTLPPEMHIENGNDLQIGTRVQITGDLRAPFDSQVPGAFNQRKYLLQQQVTALLKRPVRVVALETANTPGAVIHRFAEQMRHRVAETFKTGLPSPQSELLGGLVLGDKAVPVDRETRQAFVQTGLVHILAASGMNVGIIAAAVLWLLSLLKVPYRAKLGLAMGAVAIYALLTGLPPSIQRAATMLEIALLLKMLDRQLSPVFLLCLTTALLVAFNPDTIASIGFQFSVLTTFGLVTMVPPLQERLGYYITRWLAGLLLVPTIAQLWVWPLSVYYFNQFPVHSIPLNLLAIALVTPLTVLGFSAGLISFVASPVAVILASISRPLLEGLLLLAQWGNGMTWAQWSLPSPPPWMLAMLYGELFLLAALFYPLKNRPARQKILLALVPLVILLGGLCLERSHSLQTARVDYLPLSWKQAAWVIRSANGGHVAILPADVGYFEGRAFHDYLRHRRIRRFQGVVLLPGRSATDGSGLKTAFKGIALDHLLAGSPVAEFKPTRFFPVRQGVRLTLGGVSVQGAPAHLQVISAGHCLVALTARYQPEAVCPLQQVLDSDGVRLYQGKTELEANRHHQLVANGTTLTRY